MSNTFKKTGFRGFTLIELLVVIAIIGLLSTIIAAPIQSARKKARDAKKIAELKSTQLAFEQYAESNSAQYPHTLTALSPQFMPLLPTFASATTSNARDAFVYTYYDAAATGAATTSFSYHFGVKLEVYGPALETDRDCTAATLSNSLAVPYCAVYNGDSMLGVFVNNGSQISATTSFYDPGTAGTDFNMRWYPTPPTGLSSYTEESSSTCVVSNDCIFDVTSQQ
jgi:prepilin-type N-terminal cleavage/methylation domain-containing protein